MFHSHSLSRKGPLAAVWVAAYCHKRLNKHQVTATDIPFSVDKIIHEEREVLTYRVLGYFLLGVVRIFSKKVEYLFNDCNKVLIKVKGFVLSQAKKSSRAKAVAAPVSSITLPKRFELDAFELDQDVNDDYSGSNQVSLEDITLRDNTWVAERIGHYSLNESQWEDMNSNHLTISADFSIVHNVVPLNVMDIDVGVSISGGQTDHEARAEEITAIALLDTCPFGSSAAEDVLPPDAMDIDVGVSTTADQSNTEAITEMLHDSSFCEEEGRLAGEDYNAGEADEAPLYPNKEVGDANHSDGEPMTVLEVPISEKEQKPACEENNLEGSIENLRANVVLEMVGEGGGEPPEVTGTELEKNLTCKVKENVLGTPGAQNIEQEEDVELLPTNLELDATPPLKQNNEQGAHTPDLMLIPTPAPKERSRTKRKRKTCLFDETVVLPNLVMKKNMNDASDLVCKRKKVPHDALSLWRASRASNLFLDPPIHYSAPELRSLFYEKKLKVTKAPKDARVPVKVTISEPPQEKEVLNQEVIPSEDVEVPRVVNEDVQVPLKVDVPEFLQQNELEGIIAPETPMRCSSSRRTFESPTTAGFDEMMPRSPIGGGDFDKEQSLQEDQELSFTLMNEEVNSSEGDTQKHDGWTKRTRTVASHLHKIFAKERNLSEEEEEVVSFNQICNGRIRKESATLFYEILVLKSRGFIEVEQRNRYGDVLVRKKAKWEQAFGVAGADTPRG